MWHHIIWILWKLIWNIAGYTVCDYVFPAGESSKNAHQLIELVEYMADQSLTRKDLSSPLAVVL